MKILVVHNSYAYHGGEDTVAELEVEMLRAFGHTVHFWNPGNRGLSDFGPLEQASLAYRTIWSEKAYDSIDKLLDRYKPDIAHFHNTLPLVSPSAYYACKKRDVKVVQTVHNYRLICPGGLLLRNGQICDECVADGLAASIRHGCYQDSRVRTLPVVSMLMFHRFRNTWQKCVDRYIFPTRFLQEKVLQGGFIEPRQCIVKPHFTSAPKDKSSRGNFALYLGRLSEEKGIRVLLEAWKQVKDQPLYVLGTGPLESELIDQYSLSSSIKFLGGLSHEKAMEYVSKCSFVVIPSICYETFSMPILEAYARSKPVLSTMLGGMSELIKEGKTGLGFEARDVESLAEKANWAASNPEEMHQMGVSGHKLYQKKYTQEANHRQLLKIYSELMQGRKGVG